MSLLLPTAAARPPRLGGPAWAFGGGLPGRRQSAASARNSSCQALAHLLSFLLQQGRPENISDTGTDPRDHIMRQTPVCPARQWELPLALTGTMTSDLKFCFLLAFLRSVGSEQ